MHFVILLSGTGPWPGAGP